MDRLAQITQRFQFLEASMSAGSDGADFAKLAKEYADLRPVVEQIDAYRQLLQDMDDARAMLKDPEMAELAEEELPRLKAALPQAEADLQVALLPRDEADKKPAMLEIRPGTGGDEAALFAADLLRMYQRYAEAQGWKVELIEQQFTELGGVKEVVAHIKGENVFAHRYNAQLRRGRAAHQHDRFCRSDYPLADRAGCHVLREITAPEPRDRDAGAQGATI